MYHTHAATHDTTAVMHDTTATKLAVTLN